MGSNNKRKKKSQKPKQVIQHHSPPISKSEKKIDPEPNPVYTTNKAEDETPKPTETMQKTNVKKTWWHGLAINEKIQFCYTIITGLVLAASVFATIIASSALNETRKEFNIINEPFIQIDSVRIDQIRAEFPVIVHFNITNIRPVTTKINYDIIATSVYYTPASRQQIIDTFKKNIEHNEKFLVNTYVTQQTPLSQNSFSSLSINQKSVDSLLGKKIFIFISGLCDFENLITGEKKYYLYQVKINLFDNGTKMNFEFINNENLNSL